MIKIGRAEANTKYLGISETFFIFEFTNIYNM